jgi:hypothetical protein
MKKILLYVFVLLSISACKESQEEKQGACRTMMAAYCSKASECTGQPVEECLEVLASERVCDHDIKSSVKEIKTCEVDLATASCDSPPTSCMTLE